MQNNISLRKLFIAFFALFTLGVGEVKAWQIKANQTVYYFEYNSWGAVNFHVWGSDWSNDHTMTQIGSTPYYYYTQGGSDYNSISGFLFQKAKNDGTNKTSDLGYDVTDHTVFVDNTKYGGMKRATTSTTLYFDNTIFGYSTIYFRSGGSGFSIANVMTKVPGTANLYKVSVPQYLPFDAYCFANNCAYTGKNSVYTVDVADNTYDVTKSTVHVKSDITGELTYCYSSDGDLTDGCQYYNFSTFSGHTRRVTISDYSHGTVTAAYTDEDNSAKEKTSGSFDVAHTCNVTITAVPATGYNLSSLTVGGDAFTSGNTKIIDAITTIAAVFSAKTTTITLDYSTSAAGYGTSGSQNSVTGTYDSAMPTIATANLPKGTTGWAFIGYFDASGNKYYNADGTSAATWNKEDASVTLYAHYEKAEITALTHDASKAWSESAITLDVNPTISLVPEGYIALCWTLLYSNGTEVSTDVEEASHYAVATNPEEGKPYQVRYTLSGLSIGSYKIHVVLKANASSSFSPCSEGTELMSTESTFLIVGDNTITIRYVDDSSGKTLQANSSIIVPALGNTTVTAPDIFGYTLNSWVAGDGVTKNSEDIGARQVNISATFNGTITARYTKKNIIYFKNTIGWTSVYVNIMNNQKWGYQGTGNNDNYNSRNNLMSLVPGTTDLYYFDYGSTSTTAYVSFTQNSYPNSTGFYEEDGYALVVYPTKPDVTGSDDASYGFQTATPMFVPLATQEGQPYNQSGGKDHAKYFNKGYWHAYDPVFNTTGYTLVVYNKAPNSSRSEIQRVPLSFSPQGGVLFEATVDLESYAQRGNEPYGIKFLRGSLIYTNTSSSFSNDGTSLEFYPQADNYAACSLSTPSAGDYTFKISCDGNGKLKMGVTYPASENDFRLLYKDLAGAGYWTSGAAHTASWNHPSRVISRAADATDTVSFFIVKGASATVQFQHISAIDEGTGAITWTNDGTAINIADSIPTTAVYNLVLKQSNPIGTISLTRVLPYTGNYYIRTDCAGSTKWADFRTADHQITYSDYSEANRGYSHYYTHFVESGKNVKFVVANDYSMCISDTATQLSGETSHIDASGVLQADANIRFMWNQSTNTLKRAFLSRAQSSGTKFLVLQGQEGGLFDINGNRLLDASGNNNGGGNDAMQFSDDQNWIYEAKVKIATDGFVKLYSKFNGIDTYIYGTSDAGFNENTAIKLLGGDGDPQRMRVLYDFKTDRLIAAWEPTPLSNDIEINADVMIVREHQGAAQNIVLNGHSLATNSTIYGVMRFNRYTLNNYSTAAGHAALPVNEQLSIRERNHYYISFPFEVNVSDIFGFGTYGTHWVLQYYDGADRAAKGLWSDPGMTYWKYVPPTGTLNANEGYLLALSPSQMAYDKTGEGEVWHNGKEEVELYFPASNSSATISTDDITVPALDEAEYKCTINRGDGTDGDRRIADSYWRCIGVPSFANYASALEDGSKTFAWILPADYTSGDIHFLYEINWTDYSLRPVAGSSYSFKAMHSYMVQNNSEIVWNNVSAYHRSPVRRRNLGHINNYEFRFVLSQNNTDQDQTFIRMTDDEGVTASFEFNHDMSKELYSTKAQIYTFIDSEKAAANSLPISSQMTVVPVGVQIAADGEYTFSMPDGTSGVGVTLVDGETGVRTSLSALDYSVNLAAGTYDSRFTLEISAIDQTPTEIENVTGDRSQGTGVRKVLINGVLYIVKDGKIYDARGVRVE